MLVVRAVQPGDIDALADLVKLATQGLTSLQLNRDQLFDRVEQSVFAFNRQGTSPRGEPYVLVMVDDESSEVMGTSTVYAKTGGYQPFYVYRHVSTEHFSEQLSINTQRERLELHRTHDGPTEIGSLFLRRRFRGGGRGKWLSQARFALIASRRHRFADRVIAEMRGLADPDGTVPFWEAVSGRFLPIEFAVADTQSTVCKQFIEELMPQHPIYLDLLPSVVRDGISQVHPETQPALAMLLRQGFQRTGEVDIFDAGPVISCSTDSIGAVRRTAQLTVSKIVDQFNEPSADGSCQRCILSSNLDGFTSIIAQAMVREKQIVILGESARVLGLDIGSECWSLPLDAAPADSIDTSVAS